MLVVASDTDDRDILSMSLVAVPYCFLSKVLRVLISSKDATLRW